MGLPKFWESTDRTFGGGGANTRFQRLVIKRVKHLVGYPNYEDPATLVHVHDKDGPNYGMGSVRTLADFHDMAGLDMVKRTSKGADWCIKNRRPPPGV